MTKDEAIKFLKEPRTWEWLNVAQQIAIDMAIEALEQEPKTGHWIYDKRIDNWKCSECGCSPKTIGYVGHMEFMREHFKFCNHCGAKMIEPQESEEA